MSACFDSSGSDSTFMTAVSVAVEALNAVGVSRWRWKYGNGHLKGNPLGKRLLLHLISSGGWKCTGECDQCGNSLRGHRQHGPGQHSISLSSTTAERQHWLHRHLWRYLRMEQNSRWCWKHWWRFLVRGSRATLWFWWTNNSRGKSLVWTGASWT